jgi:hypothetical protein
MAKKKKAPAGSDQFTRLLEVAKNAKVDGSGRKFAQAMGKVTLQKQARKPKG